MQKHNYFAYEPMTMNQIEEFKQLDEHQQLHSAQKIAATECLVIVYP